jgi:hypothetical protein
MSKAFITRQLELFENGSDKQAAIALRDPAFADNKRLPIHRWAPWIAGYSAAFIDDVMNVYLPRDFANRQSGVVLDPFAGVGTTLVQAMFRSCRTVGFELNPYAALAANVKVRAPFLDLSKLKGLLHSFEAESRGWEHKAMGARAASPRGFRSRIPFFNPSVENQALRVIDFINAIEDEDLRNLFRVAFGSVMVTFSNYTYEPSLGTRPGAGKPLVENQDVAAILTGKLRQMTKDVEWAQRRCPTPSSLSSAHRVFNANFFQKGEEILSGLPVDLMVTSPPYMNNYHYVRNTRPQLYWLALVHASSELKQLEEENFGKFWQNVRNGAPLAPDFAHPGLNTLIRELRQIRAEKGPYGGPGWANYVTAYFNDALKFLGILKNVLKPGGVGVIVVGNSIVQGLEFKVDQFFAELGESVGLTAEAVHPIRRKRVGASITQSSVRRGGKNGAGLYEAAVVLRKSRHSHPFVTLSTGSATTIPARADTTSSALPGVGNGLR